MKGGLAGTDDATLDAVLSSIDVHVSNTAAAYSRAIDTGLGDGTGEPAPNGGVSSLGDIAAVCAHLRGKHAMLGFSEEECLKLYTDFKGVCAYTKGEPAEWVAAIKPSNALLREVLLKTFGNRVVTKNCQAPRSAKSG